MGVRKKSAITFVLGILALLMVVGSLSYYSSTLSVQNQLVVKDSAVLLSEQFNPDEPWLPGETVTKKVNFGNRGDADQVLRFKITEAWYDNNGTPKNLSDDTQFDWAGTYSEDPNWSPAVINWNQSLNDEWVKKEDGYYYYKKVLNAAVNDIPTITSAVIDSVTFSPQISNRDPGYADDFSDKRYSLTVQMETLDVNTIYTQQEWNLPFTISGTEVIWGSNAP